MPSCLDVLLTPWAKPRIWAVLIWVAQKVGGSQLHLEKTCGCAARERGDGRELRAGGEVVSRFAPDMPLLGTDL